LSFMGEKKRRAARDCHSERGGDSLDSKKTAEVRALILGYTLRQRRSVIFQPQKKNRGRIKKPGSQGGKIARPFYQGAQRAEEENEGGWGHL